MYIDKLAWSTTSFKLRVDEFYHLQSQKPMRIRLDQKLHQFNWQITQRATTEQTNKYSDSASLKVKK
jgi:hypothetical protein